MENENIKNNEELPSWDELMEDIIGDEYTVERLRLVGENKYELIECNMYLGDIICGIMDGTLQVRETLPEGASLYNPITDKLPDIGQL